MTRFELLSQKNAQGIPTDERNIRNGIHHEKESKKNRILIIPAISCEMLPLTVQKTIEVDKPTVKEELQNHNIHYNV
ncbi:8898_t:CDS:2 [Funneliformis caledonium]|uniref:8898_t:CDS:1 n=1 Tax=Funneliformis caledonium TaxID=1117310 RepID=A0A9N9HIJ7_9GLOM|nr:8898_t:CDS:2 [Funneliformis caledonium]